MDTVSTQSEIHSLRISADKVGIAVDFRDLYRHRELLWTLADRDIRVRYKQTALGLVWVVLQPLLASLIFAFVFGVLAHLPSNGRPYILFAFAGMAAWTTFSNALSRASFSLVSNAHVVSKVYFPRVLLPLASVASTLIDFAASLTLLLVLMPIYGVWPGPGVLLLPVWLAILLMMALGIGLLAGSLMVQYRDIGHLIPAVLQLCMYASPVAWSISIVPEEYRWILGINPLSGLLEAFRWSLLGEGVLSLPALAYSTGVAVLVCWVGTAVFQQQERNFADVI